MSSFFGIGKKNVLKLIEDKGADHFESLEFFGMRDDEYDVLAASKLVAALYDPKAKNQQTHSNLNSMRVKMASKVNVALAQLPPCESSFQQHVKRAR